MISATSTGKESASFEPHESSREAPLTTGQALGEAAKVFGRVACKFPYLMALYSFEVPSICIECLTGIAGAVVGGVVGTTAILARRCIGAKAQKFFGLESSKSLRDYSIQGFHQGARLGELPGKFIGGCGVFAFAATFFLNSKVMVPLVLGIAGTVAAASTAGAFSCIKHLGANHFQEPTRNLIQHTRIQYQYIHNFLQGRT